MKKIENRRARFDYQILKTLEAGMVLTGAEARAIRENRVNITNAYVKVVNGELVLVNAQFGSGEMGDNLSTRTRKLLVNKHELVELQSKIGQDTLTIVPLSVYNIGRFYKLELGLARALKEFRKREKIQKRDVQRDIEREFRGDKDSDNRRE